MSAALYAGAGDFGAGIASQAVSYGLNAAAASKSHDRQKNMMTRGYLYNMIGLKAAGINPILAAGSGIQGGPQGSAVAQAHAAQQGKSTPGLTTLQAQNLQSQTGANNAQAVKAGHESDILASQGVKAKNEALFWGTPEGHAMIKARAYNEGLPNTLQGAAIRGGANLFNRAETSAREVRQRAPSFFKTTNPGRTNYNESLRFRMKNR